MDKALVRELEMAQVTQNREYGAALRALRPETDAGVLEVADGFAVYAGPGSPMTQALALGLSGPVTDADFARVEAFLGRGGPFQVEVPPDFVDASLLAVLDARGYQVVDRQHVLVRDMVAPLPEPRSTAVVVRLARPGEEHALSLALAQAFTEQEEPPKELAELMLPTRHCPSSTFYAAFAGGQLVGGGTLGLIGRVAVLSGTGVRAGFRGQGAQSALIRVRLEAALRAGAVYAVTATLLETTSQHNLERFGFRVAYPKSVYVRTPPA